MANTGFTSLAETSTSLPRSRVYTGEEDESITRAVGSGEAGSDLISSSCSGSGTDNGEEGECSSSTKDSESAMEITEAFSQTVQSVVGEVE